jgi:sugar transferase (PEP-CTERM/EpsH1 system associated)
VKVLFVAPRFPAPSAQGDRLRAFYLLRELRKRHAITLLAPGPQPAGQLREDVCDRWVPVDARRADRSLAMLRGLAGPLPLQTLFFCPPALRQAALALQRSECFDIVHLHTARVAPAAGERGALVLDYIDALSLNMLRRAERERPPMRWALALEGRRMRRYEQDMARSCDQLLVSSPIDRDALGAHTHMVVAPNGVDPEQFPYAEGGRDARTVMFTGRMSYFPNADAARFLAREVLPLVRRSVADARLEIVGAGPPPAVQSLGREPGVTVTGPVADMGACLRRATLAVAPLRAGTGIQLKVLEAMASGAPLVGTPRALEGLGLADGLEALVAEGPAAIAAAIVRLLSDTELRIQIARRARARVERDYTWQRVAEIVDMAYDSALQRAQARGYSR